LPVLLLSNACCWFSFRRFPAWFSWINRFCLPAVSGLVLVPGFCRSLPAPATVLLLPPFSPAPAGVGRIGWILLRFNNGFGPATSACLRSCLPFCRRLLPVFCAVLACRRRLHRLDRFCTCRTSNRRRRWTPPAPYILGFMPHGCACGSRHWMRLRLLPLVLRSAGTCVSAFLLPFWMPAACRFSWVCRFSGCRFQVRLVTVVSACLGAGVDLLGGCCLPFSAAWILGAGSGYRACAACTCCLPACTSFCLLPFSAPAWVLGACLPAVPA